MWKTENVANYLLKGKQIYLEGRIETRSYEDKENQKKYITEVVCDANSLVLLVEAAAKAALPAAIRTAWSRCLAPAPAAIRASAPDDMNQGITDDDVPF